VACSPKSLRLGIEYTDSTIYEVTQLERVFTESRRYDILHFHTGHLHFPTSRRIGVPHVTTLHGRLDFPEFCELFRVFADVPVVSISDSQREPVVSAPWRATVYHGLPLGLYSLNEHPGDYFAFVGRISPEKRVDRAIEIAERVGLPLKIAAKVDKRDQAYHEEHIAPLLSRPHVEFVGDIGDAEKQELIGGARALLFPIDWPEPFGLAMIEAMACGTPVIAWRHGSVPEVMLDGVTGFIVDSMDGAVVAASSIESVDRAGCRAYFERRFSAARMAEDYERVYRNLIMGCAPGPQAGTQGSLVGA
jgi:glycosyltransferase involved in cell wall biosynthesis